MKNILQEIVDNKRREIEALSRFAPWRDTVCIHNHDKQPAISMSEAIRESSSGIIAEFKRRSPTKGDIFPMADVANIVQDYLDRGAAACSVLTDTRYFGGSLADLAIASNIGGKMPILRKDFIISKIQIEEAKVIGASAILLIAAILTKEELSFFNDFAHSLDLEVMVEIHDIIELEKITFTPDILGVNNRNLSSFHTDIQHCFEIVKYIPRDTVLVAESGIKYPGDIKRLRDEGFSGFLIGEALMSSPNPGYTLKKFIDESNG